MKPLKTYRQKIEYGIVAFIFFGSIVFNIAIAIFGADFGLIKERYDAEDTQVDCPTDLKYPC